MALSNVRDLYQQVILEHYKKPRHKGKTTPVHRQQRGHNPSCGDTIELTVQLNDAGNTIEDVKFEGEGCAIALLFSADNRGKCDRYISRHLSLNHLLDLPCIAN